MNKIRNYLLLFFIFILNSCDFGCVDRSEFGSIVLKSIDLHSNPFGDAGNIRSGMVTSCKEGCGTIASCTTQNYWLSIYENFDKDFEYDVSIADEVSFCDGDDGSSVESVFSFKLYEPDLNEDFGEAFITWNGGPAESPSDYVMSQTGFTPESYNCVGETVTLEGEDFVLGDQAASLAAKENIENVTVPYGCLVELYDRENFQGFMYEIHGRNNETYDLTASDLYNAGGCVGTSIFIVNRGGNILEKEYTGTGCFDPVDDSETLQDILPAPDCEYDYYNSSSSCSGSSSGSIASGNEKSGYSNINSVNFSNQSRNTWQKRVSSALIKTDSVAEAEAFTNTTDMAPIIEDNIFYYSPAIYFDGDNDFYDFSDAGALLSDEYTLFLYIKPVSGTILSISDQDYQLLERFYFDGSGGLHYQNSERTEEISADIGEELFLMTIKKSALMLKVRINGEQIWERSRDYVYNLYLPNYNYKVSVGQYFSERGYPLDFYQGHINIVEGYDGFFNDDEMIEMEEEILNYSALFNCNYGQHLDRIRMRIGDFESNEEVFDDNGDFFIPNSYQNQSGEMFFRYQDPEINDAGCPSSEDNQEFYMNNDGSLKMNFKITKSGNMVGNLYNFFIVPIERFLLGTDNTTGIEEQLFSSVTGQGSIFNRVLTLSLVLYVAITAISYLMGLAQFSNYEFFMRIFKIGVILALVSDASWDFFKEFVVNFFRYGSLQLANDIILAVNTTDPENVSASTEYVGLASMFDNLDTILSIFTSGAVMAKVLSLLFSDWTGFIMVFIFYYCLYIFLFIIAKTLLLYTAIFLMMSFAFIVAPIFIIFSLFNRTRDLFMKWLDLVVGYAMQFILLAAVVGVFSWIVLAYIYSLLGFSACWGPVWWCCGDQSEYSFVILEFFTPTSFDYRRFSPEVSADIKAAYTPNVWSMTLLWFLVLMFKEFLDFAMDLANNIAGGVSAKGIAAAAGSSLKNATKTIAKTGARGAAVVGGTALGGAGMALGSAISAGSKEGGQTRKDFGKRLQASSKKFAKASAKIATDKGYREAKGKAYSKTLGKVDEKLFGVRSPDKQKTINDIKSSVREGVLSAASKGVSSEQEIQNSVKKTLESKGFTQTQIDKVLNSSQLQKDMKYSTLQTSEAQDLLANSYMNRYDQAIKEGKSADEAKEAAKESFNQTRENIGRHMQHELGREASQGEKWSELSRKGRRIAVGDTVGNRMNNIARMSERLERSLESYEEGGDLNYKKSYKDRMGLKRFHSDDLDTEMAKEKFGFENYDDINEDENS